MATAISLIKGSLRLIGALAEGEEPSAETASDALVALRAFIESENNNSLSIYQIQDEVFTLPANQAYQTIGSGADFDTVWPVTILPSSFTRDNTNAPNTDLPLIVINQAQYNSITVKNIDSAYPQYVYYDRVYPIGKLYFWPLATSTLELHLSTWKPLRDFADLTTQVNLPPGYDRFIRYGLAMELAPEFGVEPSGTVKITAAKARRSLQAVNGQNAVLDLPANLPGTRRGLSYWDFYTGGV